jgi:hypothetical protein
MVVAEAGDVLPAASTTSKVYTPANDMSRKRSEVSPGDLSDLMDTPESQLPKTRGNKILQKDAQQHTMRRIPMRSDQPCPDEWTEEEGKQMEYGIERCILKRYGAGKVNVQNLKHVISTYPSLKEILNHNMHEIVHVRRDNSKAEEVADEIRGVPLSEETLMEKKEVGEWFKEKITCPQELIPDCCQYQFLAENTASRSSKAQQQRSAKLYQKKMGGDVKPMEVMQCGAHVNGGRGHCLPMSK